MTDNIRKITMFSPDMWGDVVEWRFKHRLNTEADSVRNLVAAGLHYYKLMEDAEFRKAEAAATNRLNGDAN
jgi:hypothetical protein